jgi:uracil-DNA glycosylase
VRPLLVGEAPGLRTSGPAFGGGGASGRRLARLAGLARLAEVFDCVNLLDAWPGPAGKASAFPLGRAREAATALLEERGPGQVVVCVGSRVWAAFGLRPAESLTAVAREGTCFVLIPHPSGVNRWWNEPGAEERAGRFLRLLVAWATSPRLRLAVVRGRLTCAG